MKIGNCYIQYISHQTQPARKLRRTANLALRQCRLHVKPRRHNTVKESDPETGLYYFGARYLDPKTGRWLSGDPAVGEYVPVAPINDDAKKLNENLPGMGGVFNYVNLHVYHYAGNNPVKHVDPDGEFFGFDDFILSLIGNISGARNDRILKGTFHNFINSWRMSFHSIAMWPQTLWFAPQEALGLTLGYYAIGIWGGTVEYDGGFKYISMPQMSGAVTLGSIGMGNPDYNEHEKGHYYQSLILGPLYIPVIGIPSLFHACLHDCADYNHFYTEAWAEALRDNP